MKWQKIVHKIQGIIPYGDSYIMCDLDLYLVDIFDDEQLTFRGPRHILGKNCEKIAIFFPRQ